MVLSLAILIAVLTGPILLISIPESASAASRVRQYGINVEPSYRPWRWQAGPNPDSWWDPASGQARVDAEVPLIAQVGVTFVRLEFPWIFLEPSAHGAYDWRRLDYIVDAANRYGIQIQPVVVFCPRWEGTPACVPNAADYGSFLGALVARYHSSIHYWEMWNESSLSQYFPAGVQQYVHNVLNPGYNAAKAIDSSAQIIASGQPFTAQSYIDGLFTAGAKFDIAAYHDYSSSASAVNSNAATIRAWFAVHGFSGPLWLGEFGLQENSVNDGTQQAYFNDVIQSTNPSAVMMWYNLRDDDIYSGPATINHSEHYGLAQHNLNLKQGYCTFHALVGVGGCTSRSAGPSFPIKSSRSPSPSGAPRSNATPRGSSTTGSPAPAPLGGANSRQGPAAMPSPRPAWIVWGMLLSALVAASLTLAFVGAGLQRRRPPRQARTSTEPAQSHAPPPPDQSAGHP